jgi:UDPglucose 6-dehydrogenase
MNRPLKVVVVGTGYVGLVTGTCLAGWGHQVTCIDVNAARIGQLKNGETPIFEPGLAELVRENTAQGRLQFSTSLAENLTGTDCVFIAVGTPPRAGDGEADLTFLYSAAKEIADALPLGSQCAIIIKSTVPVGTGDRVEALIRLRRLDLSLHVVSNPEFLREGSAIADFKRPDRVVIGGKDADAIARVRKLYQALDDGDTEIIVTSRASAELIKYASNAFLATKIAFINEIADLCEQTDADIGDVSRGMGTDHRIGMSFLNPGPGYGGSCFPKDTLALTRSAQDHGVRLSLVSETISANDKRKSRMAAKIVSALGGDVNDKRIAIFGLTFKANTDDVRDSPAISIIQALQNLGAHIRACDPKGVPHARQLLLDVDYFEDPLRCADGCDATVIVTEWDCFRNIDLDHLQQAMRGTSLIDLRRVIDRKLAERAGFSVTTLGHRSPADQIDLLTMKLELRSESSFVTGTLAKTSRASVQLENSYGSLPVWPANGEYPIPFSRNVDWAESSQPT